MTSKEAYKRFLLKLNKNDSNEGVNILPSHFVLMFNTERLRWFGEFFNESSDNWELSTISDFLEVDKLLTKVHTFEDSLVFAVPDNLYREASSYSLCDKGECKNIKVYNFEKKPLGFHTILADDFSGPQFDFEETPFIFEKEGMRVYFKDFTIKKVYLSYYREPLAIDIEGYEKIDGSPSTDIDTDLDDTFIDEILDRMVAEVSGQTKDGERFQFVKERISTEP